MLKNSKYNNKILSIKVVQTQGSIKHRPQAWSTLCLAHPCVGQRSIGGVTLKGGGRSKETIWTSGPNSLFCP